MSLAQGTRLGPYQITALLGAGGMGEVYRARDTRLGRDVAIKVLPADLTATPGARARFEREARSISHLNHPNICTLHDVGREGDVVFLVMELVSGGSLRDRLAKKALPLEQVLDLGIEIADALEAAHTRGIVHRDLKPGNILVTERGRAKVMDFGLATTGRRGARASGVSSVSATETEEEHLTSPGQAVGTVTYMSPEQARGEEVDARSDVFSLGAVLYEMASGHRAFEGGATAVIFEAILNRTPAPASILRPDTPAELDRILGKALEKDREFRYQTAGEVRSDLKRLKRDLESSRVAGVSSDSGSRVQSATAVTLPASVIARRRLMRIAWAAAVCLAFVGAILVATRLAHREPEREPVRLSLEMPTSVAEWSSLGISPNGRLLVFTATDSSGVSRIWIREMDGTTARPLPGTEGGNIPFWSPDSRRIGFIAPDSKLKTTDVTGAGQPVTVCEGVVGDGSWSSSGTILLDGWLNSGIVAVNAAGGQPNQATWFDRSRGETGHAWPQFLPDGRHFLYLAWIEGKRDSTALRLGCLGSRESKILKVGGFSSRVEYVPPGFLLSLRGHTLLAQPFDTKRLRLAGDAFPVVDDVVRADGAGRAAFSASATGALVYANEIEGYTSRLVWMDRAGRENGTLGAVARYGWGLALSPDEQRVAVSIAAPAEPEPDIWVLDVTRDAPIRLTSSTDPEQDPIWSADGRTIYFSSFRGGGSRVWAKSSSGVGEERKLPMPPGDAFAQGETPDGRFLLAIMYPPGGTGDIVKVSLDASRSTTPLGISAGSGSPSGIPGRDCLSPSPDGKWIAYVSIESGRNEVYVVDFPGRTGKWRVSMDGGFSPRWSADGKELFFMAPNHMVMSVPVSTAPRFRVGTPMRILASVPDVRDFAPTSDGGRFLVRVPARREKRAAAQVLLNWPAAGRRK